MPKLLACEKYEYWPSKANGFVQCNSWVEIDATQTQLLVSGGFDRDAFETGFGGVLILWVAGLGIGLIVSQIRKLNKR